MIVSDYIFFSVFAFHVFMWVKIYFITKETMKLKKKNRDLELTIKEKV